MSDEVKRSGLEKAATICAVGLGVSLGLCGANFMAVMSFGGRGDFFSRLLGATAYIESAGIVAFGLALVAIVMIAVVGSVVRLFKTKDGDDQ